MGILSNPLSPLAPYGMLIKLGGIALIGLALLGLVWSWHSRGQKIERLEGWQVTVVQSATLATVKPDAKGKRNLLAPEDVPAAIAALSSSLQSAEATLRSISEGALTAKAASDAADRALDRDIGKLRETFKDTDIDSWDPWAGVSLPSKMPVEL